MSSNKVMSLRKREVEAQRAKLKVEVVPSSPPPPPPPPPSLQPKDEEDALLDLEQLEELHAEAERMKALGNKHMAAQEYTRAYNAYSAALQLSPVGPSSHVFLSNRAASLLSLKRYAAAATDAKRAVALAPTFGKAHARLGQALYFLRDYQGAVDSYQTAMQLEPDNRVTLTYLEKAQAKLQRQYEREASRNTTTTTTTRNEEGGGSTSTMEQESNHTVTGEETIINSIATDPNLTAAVVLEEAEEYTQTQQSSPGVGRAAAATAANLSLSEQEQEEDPDFDSALLIQERANQYLALKQYKRAIEEYSAALFLVPDDPMLSPELHLGRAHALNGLRRHQSAQNDAFLAIKWNPTPEGYSTLAKSLFYNKEYHGAMSAFDKCQQLLPDGESLSMFDEMYLQQAKQATIQEGGGNHNEDESTIKSSTSSSIIPKLPPPRFVPREQAIQSTQNMPPTPKKWPLQSPRAPAPLQCGPERKVTFLSESLGLQLNRGTDGIVRVMSISSESVKEGQVFVGDVVREAAGVDIRRPITNIMWGDTVALIKLAPRPIVFIVAHELSEPPFSVREEMDLYENVDDPRPSCMNGPEAVSESLAMQHEIISKSHAATTDTITFEQQETKEETATGNDEEEENTKNVATLVTVVSEEEEEATTTCAKGTNETAAPQVVSNNNSHEAFHHKAPPPEPISTDLKLGCNDTIKTESPQTASTAEETSDAAALEEDQVATNNGLDDDKEIAVAVIEEKEEVQHGATNEAVVKENNHADDAVTPEKQVGSSNDNVKVVQEENEYSHVDNKIAAVIPASNAAVQPRDPLGGAEIVFPPDSSAHDWNNTRWMSTSGVRKVRHVERVARLVKGRKGFFRSVEVEDYVPRLVALFDYPNIILILRQPQNLDEVQDLLGIPDGVDIEDGNDSETLMSFLVVESVLNPKACKLRLSPLTTATSIIIQTESFEVPSISARRKSCLELISPSETVLLSAVHVRPNVRGDDAFTDSAAFLETSLLEVAIGRHLTEANEPDVDDDDEARHDVSWKHQVILGSLHSIVIGGNVQELQQAICAALAAHQGQVLPVRMIDAVDESEQTALHYACRRRSNAAVALLIQAGANTSLPTKSGNFPCHLCAENLDEKSLSTLLSSPKRPDPNVLDSAGRTPMHVAAVDGRTVGDGRDAEALGHCLAALEAWGGQMVLEDSSSSSNNMLPHPVSVLASEWRWSDLQQVMQHTPFRYPMQDTTLEVRFHYPVHAALISLRTQLDLLRRGQSNEFSNTSSIPMPECKLASTLRVLLEHGFEPNQRLGMAEVRGTEHYSVFTGYTPLQTLAVAALEADAMQKDLPAGTLESFMDVVSDTALFLVQNGAQLGVSPPPSSKTKRSASSSSVGSDESINGTDSDEGINKSNLKMDSNKRLLQLFGGEAQLKTAKKSFSELKFVKATDKLTIQHDAPDSEEETKSCSILWKPFGSIRNRRHRCRVSNRFVCDECSTKRVLCEGQEYRISDGQYLLAKVDAAKQEKERIEEQQERERIRKARVEKALSARREQLTTGAKSRQQQDEENRESLFGGVMEKAASYMFKEDDEQDVQQQTKSLADSLGQTKDALNERGEKLNSLSEKAARLNDASRDFARMAKELERNQRGFW